MYFINVIDEIFSKNNITKYNNSNQPFDS